MGIAVSHIQPTGINGSEMEVVCSDVHALREQFRNYREASKHGTGVATLSALVASELLPATSAGRSGCTSWKPRRETSMAKSISLPLIAPGRSHLREVKTRKSHDAGHPAEAVTNEKQKRITRIALAYLKHNNLLDDCSARFDVVAVTWPLGVRRPTIEH